MLRALLAIAALGGLAACSAAEGSAHWETTATTRQDLYVLSTSIWSSGSIRVCWETGGSAVEKEWVRSAVAGTWQQFSRVEFTGWGSCGPASAGVRVEISDETPHTALLGHQLDGVPSGMVLNFTFANWSPSCQTTREFCIRAIAVHEFGHALGFAHEQNRPDTPDTCTQSPQGSNGDTIAGGWDVMSVMNYCNPQWNNAGRLSETDKLGLQDYYGRPNDFADVTGDGEADALLVNDDGLYVQRSDGASAFGAREKWTETGALGTRGTYFADVTGDGRADAIVVDDERITVRRSTGDAFAADETWSEASFFGAWGTFFADVTGDGKADAIAVDPDAITVRSSSGSSFGPAQTWLAMPIPTAFDLLFGDVTGDGRADLVLVTTSGVVVCASTGSAFGVASAFTASAYYGARGTFLADVTGDGKADAVAVDDDVVTVRRSTATAFLPAETWSSEAYYGARGTYFADVAGSTGAGAAAADAIVVNDKGTYVRPSNGSSFDAPARWTRASSGTR